VLAGVSMIVAACTGSSGSSATSRPSATDPASSSAPASPGTASPGTPPTGAASSPPATSVAGSWSGYGPCPDLEVKLGLAQGTSNTTFQVLDFINRGQVSCILDG
jgi:hypothetical protein